MIKGIFKRLFLSLLIGGILASCTIVNYSSKLFAYESSDCCNPEVIEPIEIYIWATEQSQKIISNINLFKYIDLMPIEHLNYLEEKCRERNIDFELTISIIKAESNFDCSNITNEDFGYFQINLINHQELAKKLNTLNKPLDPYININWELICYPKYKKVS